MFKVFPFLPRGVPGLGEGGRTQLWERGSSNLASQWRLGTASDGRGRATDTADTMATSARGPLLSAKLPGRSRGEVTRA